MNIPRQFPYNLPLRPSLVSAGIGLLCIFGFLSGWAGLNPGPVYFMWVLALFIAPLSICLLIKRFVKPGFIDLNDDSVKMPQLFGDRIIRYAEINSLEDVALQGLANRGKRYLIIKSHNDRKLTLVQSWYLENIEQYSELCQALESRCPSAKIVKRNVR